MDKTQHKRPLPDHGIKAISKKIEYFTYPQLTEIKRKFKFKKNDLTFAKWLEDAAWRYMDGDDFKEPPHSEQKHLFNALIEQSDLIIAELEDLGDVLSRLGWEERRRLFEQNLDARTLNEPFFYKGSYRDLILLCRSAKAALAVIKDEQPIRKQPNYSLQIFVSDLINIYESGTGKKAGYTQAPESSHYTGDFIDLVCVVLNILGHPENQNTIGRLIKNIISNKKKSAKPSS